MVDLMMWRAAIGVFVAKCQRVPGCCRKMSPDCAQVSNNTNTVTHLSAADVVVGFVCCAMLISMIDCLISNSDRLVPSDCFGFEIHEISKGTTWLEMTGLCDSDSGPACQPGLHVPVILVAFCVQHAAFSLRRLLLSGDVETNPGPNMDGQTEAKDRSAIVTNTTDVSDMMNNIMQVIQQQFSEQTSVIRHDLGEIKNELRQVKQQCEEINQRCDRLERDQRELAGTVTDITEDIHQLFEERNEDREDVQKLSDTISDLKTEIGQLKADTDRLENFSRRDNLRLFGIPQQTDKESNETCAQSVIDMLNSVDDQKSWTLDDIARAHRTGQARDGQPRPMIAKFSRWRDKMSILTDKDLRQKLQDSGVRVANDLTRAQAQMVAAARREGRRAYFHRGQMVMGPRLPDPRSYAEVVESGGAQQSSTPVPPSQSRQQGDSPFLTGRGGVTSEGGTTPGSRQKNRNGRPPSPSSSPSVARATRNQHGGDVTGGSAGGRYRGNQAGTPRGERHSSATVGGDSPRCDVACPTASEGRAARDGPLSYQQTGMRDFLRNPPRKSSARGKAASDSKDSRRSQRPSSLRKS